jgi:hypothetical protein
MLVWAKKVDEPSDFRFRTWSADGPPRQMGATMFKATNSTVFILGAGASWHYGYPTGETLVQKVIEKASIAARYFENSLHASNTQRPEYLTEGQSFDVEWPAQWERAHDECVKLKLGLEQVKPLVIDYYLGWNQDLQNIGRMLIAWVILECEQFSQRSNINRPPSEQGHDDWYRFIIHQIAIHCKQSKDLLLNEVSFVTFNYDVSLENNLGNGLRHIKMFDGKDVTTFLGGTRIIHIYGKIRDDVAAAARMDWVVQGEDPKGFNEFRRGDYYGKMKTLLDVVYAASKGLRVIDPHDKGTDDRNITMARRAIADAKRVFILGYGFDEHNSERLNLREYLAQTGSPGYQLVAFTNYQDINQINKRASKLFYGHSRNWPPGGPAIEDRYEKSIRNTYDALAFDFDLAE